MRCLLFLVQELLVAVPFGAVNAPKRGKRYRVVDPDDEMFANKDHWSSVRDASLGPVQNSSFAKP